MSRLDRGDSSGEIKPSSSEGSKKPLILDLFQNTERTAIALMTSAVRFEEAPADPVRDARARFEQDAKKVAAADKLSDAQVQSLKRLGAAFLSDSGNPGGAMQKALNDLPLEDRLPVLEAFQKVLEGATEKKLRVEIDGDGKGSYTVTFSGDLVCDGKGKVKFNSQDGSVKAVKKDGGDLDAASVTSSRDAIRGQVAKDFVAKEEDKPAEKKEAPKADDANTTACRDAFKKMVEGIYKDEKTVNAALAIFDHYKGSYGDTFKRIQEKYDAQTDKDLAAKQRNNTLAELFNTWVDLAKKEKPIGEDILKKYPEIKKTDPKRAEQIQADLDFQAARKQWLQDSKGKPLPLADLPKEKPAEPKIEPGVAIAGVDPHKPKGGSDVGAVERHRELAGKGKLDDKEAVELKTYKDLGWTSNEPQYQYARAAYMKGAEIGLNAGDMKSLEKLLTEYVAYFDNGKRGKAPNIAEIRKLLKLK